MNAEEMFKELGYAKKNNGYRNIICYEKDASIRNLQHIIGIQFVLNDECVSVYSHLGKNEFGAFNYLNVKLLNAINKQCKELGWLEEKQETNYEHYKDEIIQNVKYALALVNGELKPCADTNCDECEFKESGKCVEKVIEWLKKPYKKKTYKLSQFEYDLIQTYRDGNTDCNISDRRILRELKDKGYFKCVDHDTKIHDILANCEVIK